MIDNNSILKAIIQPQNQKIINSKEFYFQKGQDALKKWLDMNLSKDIELKLKDVMKNYKKFAEEFSKNEDTKKVQDIIFEIISYCDTHTPGKNSYNEYDDKRTLALANVWNDDWVEKIIQLKLYPEVKLKPGSVRNAVQYLLTPENGATILSENHRKWISKHLFKKEYSSENFVQDLISYFNPFDLQTDNTMNYTLLLSNIIYANEDCWKENVVALIASDNTGWQEERIENMKADQTCLLWNTKKPGAFAEVERSLKKAVKDKVNFYLYYSGNNLVKYRASIIDFAINTQDMNKKGWVNKYSILNPNSKFDIKEGKAVRIVFLAKTFEKIDPIPVTDFDFYDDYQPPRQDNISPVRKISENQSEEIYAEDTLTLNSKNGARMKNESNLNQILYGPPGTGKTYHTVDKALEIICPDELKKIKNSNKSQHDERHEVKKLFDEKVNEGQIVFTTFHQSLSYEDFIEGIKPVDPEENKPMQYKTRDGIFKQLCIEAAFTISQARQTPESKEMLDYFRLYDDYVSVIEGKILKGDNVELELKDGGKISVESISDRGNFNLRHKGGSRSYIVSKDRLLKLESAIKNLNEVSNFNNEFREVIGGSNASAFWAVLNDFNSFLKTAGSNLSLDGNTTYTYEEKKKVVQTLTQKDYRDNKGEPYVLIIDEINRGNIAEIFGELITLIEDDKRLGKGEALEAILPYSNERFGVPSNLYIIGTMNTADRSVEALDTALRRRFVFEEKKPDSSLIAEDMNGLKLRSLLETINIRIEQLLDKDHLIGHSYLMNLKSTTELKEAFSNKIIPLLQEYFFGDYGKIGLVLGEGFFKEQNNRANSFAKFYDYSGDEYSEKPVYSLEDLSKMEDSKFEEAVKMLLNPGNNAQ